MEGLEYLSVQFYEAMESKGGALFISQFMKHDNSAASRFEMDNKTSSRWCQIKRSLSKNP